MFLHVSVILFTGGGWYPSMHCRWYPSMPCSWGWYPSMPRRFPGLHPGEVEGSGQGGLQAHTQDGVSRATPRWGCIPVCTEADPLPPAATAAGSARPTGMHSCCWCLQKLIICQKKSAAIFTCLQWF